MKNTDKTALLDPARVDCQGNWLLWPREPKDNMLQSIQELGQLEPVVVREGTHRPLLVCGYTRVAALRHLQQKVVAVFRGIDHPDLALAYVHSNSGRIPSPGQTSAALRYYCRDEDRRHLMYQALDIPLGSTHFRQWENWLQLESPWDPLLDKGHLPLKAADILAALTSADRDALFPFFTRLSWSRNKALQFLNWAYESGRIYGEAPAEVIRKSKLPQILEQDLSPKDAISALLREMQTIHSPHITAFREKKNNICRELTAGTCWRAEHADNLESKKLHISTDIASARELDQRARELSQMAESGAFELWDEFRESFLVKGKGDV